MTPKLYTNNNISVVSYDFSVAAEDPWQAGGLADLIANGIIEISDPNNHKIAIRNDKTSISISEDGG